jgi:hypothetical protein
MPDKIKYIFNIMSSQGYIKNMGSTQTFIKIPYEKERYNDIHWDANYDGEQANIRLNIDDNGNNAEIKARLDNNDLAQLLNVPLIRGDLDARLTNDFLEEKKQIPISFLEKVEENPIIILRQEKVHPNLRFQPFLRPQKSSRRLKYNKLPKQLKDASPKLVGKTAALQYRTPLPKTMRIHLTSNSSGRGNGKGTRKKKRNGRRKSTRRNRGVSLFRNLF